MDENNGAASLEFGNTSQNEEVLVNQQKQIQNLQEMLNQILVNQVIHPPPNINNPAEATRQNGSVQKHHLELIPTFDGTVEALNGFLEVTQKLYDHFYNPSNPQDFQNYVLLAGIKSKIVPPASNQIVISNLKSYREIRNALLKTYQDKRDNYTLVLELANMRQSDKETPFHFHDRITKQLNLLIAYTQNHEVDDSDVLIKHYQNLALRCFLLRLQEPMGSLLRTRAPGDLGIALSWLHNDYQTLNSNTKQNSQQQQRPNTQTSNRNFQYQNQSRPQQSFSNPQSKPNQSQFQSKPNQPAKSTPQTQSNQNNSPYQKSGQFSKPNQNFQPRAQSAQVRSNPSPRNPVTPMSWQTSNPNFHNIEQSGDPECEPEDNPENEENPQEQDSEENPFLEETGLESQNSN